MKFIKLFNVFKGSGESINTSYIYFEDFANFIRSKDKDVRVYNIKYSLKGLQEFNGKLCVPVASVFKYCFRQADTLKSCKFLAELIENDVLRGATDDTSICASTSYELYKLIAKTKFTQIEFPLEKVKFDESTIETLVIEHKSHFNEKEWKKICWFESHFTKSLEYELGKYGYEEIIGLKYSKFQSILNFKECSENWLKATKSYITKTAKRISYTDILRNVEYFAKKKHRAVTVESDLLLLLQNYCENDIVSVIAFDTHKSKTNNSIQVITVTNTENFGCNLNDLSERAYYYLVKKHDLKIECLHYIHNDNLKTYERTDYFARYLLRDDIELNQVPGIFHSWSYEHIEHDGHEEDGGESEDCTSCFSAGNENPLHASSADIIKEWCLELPIESQLILEKFVNTKSLKKSKDDESFICSKIEKLYRVHDILLNTFNKNFSGIYQTANTEELLIEYKSVQSVFDVTTSSGITSSLRHAENNLKKKASDEICYYNTFLKQHNLEYTNNSGQVCSSTSLRQCHVILMLDNLVRLRYIADPNPGEGRSKQLCTLPITLQGLPVDSFITSLWHGENCDGSNECCCKKQTELTKHDVEWVLLKLSNAEKKSQVDFFNLMTWGPKQLWKHMTDDLLVHFEADHDSSGSVLKISLPSEFDTDANSEEDVSEDELDLANIIGTIESTDDLSDQLDSDSDHEQLFDTNIDFSNLEQSFENITICEEEDIVETFRDIQLILSSFGFNKFAVPPLLCRHPPPAVGRDDDIHKIREILDDILRKMGYLSDPSKFVNRILCGPDNKIGKSIMALMEIDDKYKVFLPEFPLLHLRKSGITILFSSYKDAGILQILKFMRDDKHDEWKKLVSAQHIDSATKYIRRVSLSLHLAFLIAFSNNLSQDQKECFLQDMESGTPCEVARTWSSQFEKFLEDGSNRNATFALHVDMMRHCDSIVAISFAERLGGSDGYTLLLGSVKESLPYLFVNNATSYAPYCVKLLYHHYSAGHFHQGLKSALFSTPFRNSTRNFACDTKRELDHIQALKGFRSGSNLPAVSCRMSLIDSLNEVKDKRRATNDDEDLIDDDDVLGWELTEVDKNHIFPTADLILRKGAICMDENDIPLNVYTKNTIALPLSILDRCSKEAGVFLMHRFLAKEKLFGLTCDDIPSPDSLTGPSEIISRARKSKGVTIKRTVKSKVQTVPSERQEKELQRQKSVAKETKRIDHFSSENNNCQALVKPDSSKPKVMKSIGMQRALAHLVNACINTTTGIEKEFKFENLIALNLNRIPVEITTKMKLCMVEFAGVKFKTGNITSGKEYLRHCETVINSYLRHASCLHTLVICEEKYSHTPDEFKACTREQRNTKSTTSIDHLKTKYEIIGDHIFNKEAVTKTETGKRAISTYLAEHFHMLSVKKDVEIILDSEYKYTSCSCKQSCSCSHYATPVVRSFRQGELNSISSKVREMTAIQQKKGEAEMAVVDWAIYLQDKLEDDECIVSIISSGDIDAVYIHLYAISKLWKRNQNGKFSNTVYVVLQKPKGKNDVYNITTLLEIFEEKYHDRDIGLKIALGLCLGGNDFMPKCHQISHETVLNLLIENDFFRQNLVVNVGNVQLNYEVFKAFFKTLYCPKRYLCHNMSYEEVRAITIGKSEDQSKLGDYNTNDPRRWLPPESAIEKLADLFHLQIQYLETAGNHSIEMPDFLGPGCLVKNNTGEIEYNFGPHAHFESFVDLPVTVSTKGKKRSHATTPQHGARRKRHFMASTPKRK